MLKAVVDTNVLISGTIRKSGHPNRIMNAWREGLFVLVTSESFIEEAGRVFRYPMDKPEIRIDGRPDQSSPEKLGEVRPDHPREAQDQRDQGRP
jgi:predicted nucleic acid-binding protein